MSVSKAASRWVDQPLSFSHSLSASLPRSLSLSLALSLSLSLCLCLSRTALVDGARLEVFFVEV